MADRNDRSPSPPVSRRESYYYSQRASQSSAGSPSRREPLPTGPSQNTHPRRSYGYDVPDTWRNLNEFAAPPPVENPREAHLFRHHSLEEEYPPRDQLAEIGIWPTRSRTRSTRRRSSRPAIEEEEEYSFPEAYENLNELAGPSPIENPDEGEIYRHETLEEERERSQQRRRSRRLSKQPESIFRRLSKGVEPPPPRESTPVTALPSLYQQHDESRELQLQAAQQEAAKHPRRQGASRFATLLYVNSYLIFFSILGTLARLGIQWLTFYPGAPVVTSVLWANFAGSFFMGFLAEDRRLFREEWGTTNSFSSFEKQDRNASSDSRSTDHEEALRNHARIKKTIPLYIGLATGFCGSLTSFSSFVRDVFLSLSNNLPTPVNHPYPAGFIQPSTTTTVSRNGGYSFMALIAVVLLTVCLSMAALKIGAHTAITLDPLTPTFPFVLYRKIFDRVVVVLAFGCWLGAVLMCIWPADRPGGPAGRGSWNMETWRGQALFACVFAPLGCLARFYASLHLNGLSAAFPLGTFAVNILGTAIEGMAFDLQHVSIGAASAIGGGRVSCQVLQGIMDGFCGCLTTVSTWVAELNGLRRVNSYTYGAASVVGGLVMMIAIMGSVRWTVGWDNPVCVI